MSQPNVLLIVTDQQRWDTIAAGGNAQIRTPHLDRLVREGTNFTSAYTPAPVCVPARCSLHYGQYPLTTGCYENNFPMPKDRPSIADVLTAAGYRTHAIGKRHFTPDPMDPRGFQSLETQEEIVGNVANDDYLQYLEANGCDYAIEPHGVRGEAYYVPQLSGLPPRHHPTQWIGDRSCQWLSEASTAPKPFFLQTSFIHPHPPFSPPTPWHKLYRAADMPMPKMAEDNESLYLYTNYIQNRYKGRDAGRDLRLHQLIKSYYWASISFIDHQVGQLLATLEASNQLDQTLVIFTSDHGEFLGDYNCFGKRSYLDSAARVPLISRLPGVFKPRTSCDSPVSLVDIMPTILAATGTEAPAMDGTDLADIANNPTGREAVFGHYQSHEAGIYMACTRDWKYIWSAPDNRELLFDRIKDPHETRNRAHNVVCSAAAQHMRTLLQQHLKSCPGNEDILNDAGWISKNPIRLPDDPDAGLIVQDPPCYLDRLHIPGYSSATSSQQAETGANFNPLKNKR